ncbi:MAG: hypothetical protein AUI16_03030 [Alphaproteobacteria bacterium 13_2_20CM_2_64_7]|jgi:predicted DNA-binding transcriptional regulator AlpA|nr:MAG: hypothetical protein AUI16_03030 [Alphaproteobacteria bacterium 13_2_20CM_2_64_7]
MRLLDYEDLRGLGIRYSKCQLWRRERDNSFPQSVKLSSARKCWREDEILAWIDERIAKRDQAAA